MEAYIQLTGNVGGTIDFHKNTVPIASFRLAHTPRTFRNGEWMDAPTTWITVSCYRTLAENVAVSLGRGQPVLVAGRLRTHVWEKDGITYERLTLEATAVGHDLSRGTASFVRGRVAATAEDRDEISGEMPGDPTDGPPEPDQVSGELVGAWSNG